VCPHYFSLSLHDALPIWLCFSYLAVLHARMRHSCMKILIVGAGVGGCALVGFIQKYNLGEVTLVERTEQLGNMGYLIALWGNGRSEEHTSELQSRVDLVW